MSEGSPCAETHATVPSGGLGSFVAQQPGVVVGVPRADRGAAHRELDKPVHFELQKSDQPLTELGASVLAVPGRCVLLARRTEQGWEILTTPGGWTAGETVATVVPMEAPPEKLAPPHMLWVGLGMAYGYPNLASGIVAAKVGPLAFEASLTPPFLLYIDAYWRVGATLPLPVPMSEFDRLELGLHGGQRAQAMLLFMSKSGPSFAFTVDGYLSQRPHIGAVIRLSAGVDCFTGSEGYHDITPVSGCLPSVQIGGVVTFGE